MFHIVRTQQDWRNKTWTKQWVSQGPAPHYCLCHRRRIRLSYASKVTKPLVVFGNIIPLGQDTKPQYKTAIEIWGRCFSLIDK